jgi:pimeloyl-ACP methyl ester carboxylesterase
MPVQDFRRFGFPMPKPVQRDSTTIFGRLGALPQPSSPDERRSFAKWPPVVPESQRGTDIFIGGSWDDWNNTVSGAMRHYKDSYAQETGRRVAYFPNAKTSEVVEAIRTANRAGGPVNVVGHSYGGPDAYNAAVRAGREGLRVGNVVTLDPVTAFGIPPERGRPAGTWTNVKAAPAAKDGSDWITNIRFFSKNPSRLPVFLADRPVAVAAHHSEVERMMTESGAREVLDASRRSRPDMLSDSQPIGA